MLGTLEHPKNFLRLSVVPWFNHRVFQGGTPDRCPGILMAALVASTSESQSFDESSVGVREVPSATALDMEALRIKVL